MTRQRQAAGRTGEEAAARCLARAGYVILARNYRCPFGEIDLVALDRRTVVFIEVKARRNDDVVSPLESVTRRQQRRIARAAVHYLGRYRLLDRPVRFDIVGVWLGGDDPRCELVRGAFESDGVVVRGGRTRGNRAPLRSAPVGSTIPSHATGADGRRGADGAAPSTR